MSTTIPIPTELKNVPRNILGQYVMKQISHFEKTLKNRFEKYGVLNETYDKIVMEINKELYGEEDYNKPIFFTNNIFNVSFSHACTALGCNELECRLCSSCTEKRCASVFDKKYYIGDSLKTKCNTYIRINININAEISKFHDLELQLSALDGNKYKNIEDKELSENDFNEELNRCEILQNKNGEPLLTSSDNNIMSIEDRLHISLNEGQREVILTDIKITDSSESLLSGKRPKFFLLVRLINRKNNNMYILKNLISDGFIVATRRTKTSGKVDIPKCDDPVSKLDHIGKESVKKLKDLKLAAEAVGVEMNFDGSNGIPNCVRNVMEFRILINKIQKDYDLKYLQTILKLTNDKWDEVVEHATKCVTPDSLLRLWYSFEKHSGLIFSCHMGNIQLDEPISIIEYNHQSEIHIKSINELNTEEDTKVHFLKACARQCWYLKNHPEWSIIPYDSDLFTSQNVICQIKVTDNTNCIIDAIMNYLETYIPPSIELLTEETPIDSPFFNKDNIPDLNDSFYKINDVLKKNNDINPKMTKSIFDLSDEITEEYDKFPCNDNTIAFNNSNHQIEMEYSMPSISSSLILRELKDTFSNSSLDLNVNMGLYQNQFSSIHLIDPTTANINTNTNTIFQKYNESSFELRINSISSIQDSLSEMSISVENKP